MSYRVLFTKQAQKEFLKLNKDIRSRIDKAITTKLYKNPGQHLIALHGSLRGMYKFRVGEYRLVCKREDDKLIILVLTVKHRREVYKK